MALAGMLSVRRKEVCANATSVLTLGLSILIVSDTPCVQPLRFLRHITPQPRSETSSNAATMVAITSNVHEMFRGMIDRVYA